MNLNLLKKSKPAESRKFGTGLLYFNGDDWLDTNQFKRSMKREIARSYRSGHSLSYIIFDISEYTELKINDFNSKRSRFSRFMKLLIDVISNYTREIDFKCYNSQDQIDILLLDTPVDGAKIYINKIREEIVQRLESEKIRGYQEILDAIQISAYPLNQLTGKDEIRVNFKLQDKFSNDNIRGKQSGQMKKQSTNLEDILNTDNYGVSSGGAISVSSNLDWNSENFSKVGALAFLLFKRLVDIFGALFGIILFSPLMIFIASTIKLTSKGPALFRQQRVGYMGSEFTFFKFRSMRIDMDDSIHQEYVKKLIEGKTDEINQGTDDEPVYKIVDDPRITKIGQFIRKTSLDELPQFFNVLFGQMSLVGPRPPIPYEIDNYKNWHLKRVLEVKPGITGMWQVYGRSQTTFDDMVRYDLQYVNNQTIWLDIKLLFKTFLAIFGSQGAM